MVEFKKVAVNNKTVAVRQDQRSLRGKFVKWLVHIYLSTFAQLFSGIKFGTDKRVGFSQVRPQDTESINNMRYNISTAVEIIKIHYP